MIEAIVYTSNTGHTKEYAELLGQEIGKPVLELKEAAGKVAKGAEIIYLGWLMAGTVKGYDKARKHFCVKAVCAVGMAPDDSQKPQIIKTNKLPDDLPLFIVNGGFEMEKLHGVYRFMMKTMKSFLGKKLQEKPDRTPEEEEMLDMLYNGKKCVSKERFECVIRFASEGQYR